MAQSLKMDNHSTEFARRARADRVLRVRAALRAEAVRSATIGISRWRWWWPWSQVHDDLQNLAEHFPGNREPDHLEEDVARDFKVFDSAQSLPASPKARTAVKEETN